MSIGRRIADSHCVNNVPSQSGEMLSLVERIWKHQHLVTEPAFDALCTVYSVLGRLMEHSDRTLSAGNRTEFETTNRKMERDLYA
jgi:hypothetical protein